MVYTIYTFGSGVEIGRILSSLALLCNNESFFNPIITMSASIGAMWAGVNAVWGDDLGGFLKKYIVPSLLLFNLMFVPKVNVGIVDHVDDLHRAEKIDGVPVGVALVASVASNIAYYLTDQIEIALTPATASASGNSYLRTGPMFAAHLMGASRDLVIVDPTLRDNVKAYVDQCFVWPYLYTNIGGQREEALRTNNIYAFIKSNAHPGLGMFWKDGKGRSTFLKCSEVPAKLDMTAENNKAMLRLAAQVLPGSAMKSPADAERDMNTLGCNAWDTIARDTGLVHERVAQQMLINAGREAIDDNLERFGSPRRYPRLISYSATRAEEQQNMGYLITGVMASRQMPQLQGVIFGLLLISFTVVVAYTFIPGSLKIWGMWIKMILWVQSWPIFYGILNCIGLILLHKSTATIRLDYGQGITWLTQNGLADAAWSSYAIVQNLFLAIPFLSWAIISASSQGLVALAERAMPMLGRALGQSIVDNTTSYDTQSMHNTSALNTQLAQQTLGTNVNTSSTMSDGRMTSTTASDGHQTLQENQSKTRFSMDLQNSLQGQFSQQLSKEQQAAREESSKFSASRTSAIDKGREFLKAYSMAESNSTIYSEAENKAIQESVRQYLSSSDRNSHTQNLTDSKNWSFSMDMGVSATNPIGGVGANASVGMGGSASATNDTTDQHSVDVTKGRDINQDVMKAINLGLNNQLTYNTDSSKSSTESFRAAYSDAKTHATELSTHLSRIDRLQEMGSITESQGYTFNEAKTDEFLEYVAHTKGMSKVAAGYKMSHDREFGQQGVESFLDSHKQKISTTLEEKIGPMDSAGIDKKYKGYSAEVDRQSESINEGVLAEAEKQGMKEGVSTSMMSEFSDSNAAFKDRVAQDVNIDKAAFKQIEKDVQDIKGDIEQERLGLQNKFKDKKDAILGVRALKKIVSDD